MISFISTIILFGTTAYAVYKYTTVYNLYEDKCNETHQLKLNLAVAEDERNNDYNTLQVAYNRIDNLEDQYAELCDRTGTTPEDSFVANLCDGIEYESTYEYDDNGNLVGPDGFTYNVTDPSIYSDDGNVACDRIKWTPDNVYTPDVDGDDDNF
jgi:hypothetical protein